MKMYFARDIAEAACELLDVLTHTADDNYRRYSRVRRVAAELLRDWRTRYGQERAELLIDLAAAQLAEQGFLQRTPLEGEPDEDESDFVLDITEQGWLKLRANELPVVYSREVKNVRRKRPDSKS
jgi:hypothetical protein